MPIQKIIEEFEKKWEGGDDGLFHTPPAGPADLKEKIKAFLLAALRQVYQSGRQEALEELERKFQNQEYNIDSEFGEFLSKQGIINLLQSKIKK